MMQEKDRGMTHFKKALWNDFISKIASLVIFILLIMSFFGAWICTQLGIDPETTSLFNRLSPPSDEHILGTDSLGRDVLARLIMGTHISLSVAAAAALFSCLLGCIIGLSSGFFGRWVDRLLMRFTDTTLSLPLLPLLIIVSAIDFEKLGFSAEFVQASSFALYKIVFIIALFAWPASARLVRAGTLSAKEQLYVLSSRALGASELTIMVRHILPNVIAPLIVAASLAIGNIIILESSLSFLGLGIQPPTSSWGNMLQGAEDFIWDAPLLALWPGLAIFVTVIAFNVLGDSLREAYNPKST
jgi:peptide/nickel transport system permease protein